MKKRDKILLALALFIVAVLARFALASPHTITGTVFTNFTIIAPDTKFRLENSVNGANIYGVTDVLGDYLTTIDGSDGDVTLIYAWNDTNYGWNYTALQTVMTTLHAWLNETRGSEANLSLNMSNHTRVNITESFNFTANISTIGSNGTDCNATISIIGDSVLLTQGESLNHSLGLINTTPVLTTWNLSANSTGTVNISIRVNCSSDSVYLDRLNLMTAGNITVVDLIPPVIYLERPLNSTWLNTKNTTIFFNVTDASKIKNCSAYLNSTLNQSTQVVSRNQSHSFTINTSVDGPYEWYVECYDNSTTPNFNVSTPFQFNIDATPPNITLFAPANGSSFMEYLHNFTFNVTDENNVTNCTLAIDGKTNATNYSINQNEHMNFTAELGQGVHHWYINCSDNISNTGQSQVWTLTIEMPDIEVNWSLINFSTTTPIEGTNVQVNSTIRNKGLRDATSVKISVFENSIGGVQIGANSTFDIAAGDEVSLVSNWTAQIGIFNITIFADPPQQTNGSINESNETNNYGNSTIFLEAYTIFYGETSLDIVLAPGSGQYMRQWVNKSNLTGNIYVTGTNTKGSINWTGLEAIGLKKDGNRTINDWEEIDSLLNMSNLTDSINSTYTDKSVPRNISSFLLQSYQLNNVSVVNSTMNWNFTTGILWDTSDSLDDEYDAGDAEDIIFITTVNRDKAARFGIYDFEIKVPAKLRKYRNASLDVVQFYTELN